MNLKTRMIISRVIIMGIGVCLTIMGITGRDRLLPAGLAILAVSAVQAIKTARILSNGERYRDFENRYNDERNIYIARKSYAFTFFASIYAEFAAYCVLSYLGREEEALMFAYMICGQALLYWIANLFYRRKN